jgi:hypothetical protein
MTIRQSARQFVADKFPQLSEYRFFTSRMFEAKDKASYYDDWWLRFPATVLDETDFVVFAGAMDYSYSKFRLFKVPSSYLAKNLDKLDINSKGVVSMYIHIKSYDEIRKGAGVSFKPYVVN